MDLGWGGLWLGRFSGRQLIKGVGRKSIDGLCWDGHQFTSFETCGEIAEVSRGASINKGKTSSRHDAKKRSSMELR